MPEPLWKPSPERVESAQLTAFRRRAEAFSGEELSDYFDLHAWSVRDIATFWDFYLRDSGVPVQGEWSQAVTFNSIQDAHWFEGARLNYARALLYPPGVADDAEAIVAVGEDGQRRAITWTDLRRLVGAAQRSLQRDGVRQGDRVVAFTANVPEAIVVMLACASLGVVFSSCSPDFGFEAALNRFGQIAPRVLFATTAYRYGGRRFDVNDVVKRLAGELGVATTVLLPYPLEPASGEGVAWDEWLSEAHRPPEFSELPFDHPLYILYSSGTTGKPKAIVHRAGGALLTHHKELRLHSDIGAGDRVAYYTTCGWMMWNWLVSALSLGATVVLVEGSPAFPEPESLLKLAENERLTFLGTSARYIHALQQQDADLRGLDLSALRTIASTGSPLSDKGFEFVYERVKDDVHLASISGGTDIVGCFMLGVPTLPVYRGQIQAPGLGVDIAAFDDDGRPLQGEPGELVCRQPLPSMPLHFWNDDDGERYRNAYFEHFPGVWRHGDLVEFTPQGGVVVYGRSDATLNPGGVRIGTAEIYRPLEGMPEVVEAIAAGRREGSDESIWLFVVLESRAQLNEELVSSITRRIREGASPRHVPAQVVQVGELPRTRSGKPMEMAVVDVLNGRPVKNREVIANPASLEDIEKEVRAALAGATRT